MKEVYCIIITSYADEENGKKIINALLTARLAACIQTMPIQSYYHWQGKVAHDDERLLFIKTKPSLYAKVEETILAHHAYELPEIVQVPISTGLDRYLHWIDKECC
ncbi:divalent-cation tolerance protein CutA [Candidatus Electrothrix sp.]|uniref:divalent-cation tolerance protein CutA n=1 Tax=Candidatus Electrothrix sp. TaxID=2170559 RepID=UPI0040578FCD